MRYFIKVFYDGTQYFGYQRQPKFPTVEENIIKGLKNTGFIDSAKQSNFKSASRTDKHVSAIGNVFAFNTEDEPLLGLINSKISLDYSILCWAKSKVPSTLSPRTSISKKYWYVLPWEYLNNTTDLSIIRSLCKKFEGTHNFKLFCKNDHRNTIRSIDQVNVKKFMNIVIFEFVGESFLWAQIRRIMFYLLNYSTFSSKYQDVEHLLEKPEQVKNLYLRSADPHYLVLIDHYFENIEWTVNDIIINKLKKIIKNKLLNYKKQYSLFNALHFHVDNFIKK